MITKEMFEEFYKVAGNPAAVKDKYIAEGKKVIHAAPVLHTRRDSPFNGTGTNGCMGC